MKKFLKWTIAIITSIFVLVIGFVIIGTITGTGRLSLPVIHGDIYKNDNQVNYPSRLHTKKNQLVDEAGKTILLKGLMAPDPHKLSFDNKFNEEYYKGIWKTEVNVIRVPVHPERWANDKYYLWRYLDKIVTWAGKAGVYVIIDWHYIGNIATGAGSQMPDIDQKPEELTKAFWIMASSYFKNAPNVIFEIYNEPADIGLDDWYKNAKDIVKTIRSTGAKQLIIVGGTDYSYDISWAINQPIPDSNVAYASHVYPSRSYWDESFGNVAARYPVIVTEWGFMDENRSVTSQSFLISNENTYGKPFMKYLKDNGIGWVACWYDDNWEPPMFNDGFSSYTKFGAFVINELKN